MHQSIKAGTAVEVEVVGKLRDCSSRKVSGLTPTAVFVLATLKAPLIGAVNIHAARSAAYWKRCMARQYVLEARAAPLLLGISFV
jgi:hypothetical protein